MKTQLTPKQQQVLQAIKQFYSENGYPPTVRELAELCGHASAAGMHKILQALHEKGALLRRGSGKSRSFIVADDIQNSTKHGGARLCPIVGNVVAGMPQLAVEEIEGQMYLDSEWVGQEDIFLLRVRGHSMIDADIRDGDLLVVQKTQTCRNGDIIIALLEEEATVKRFYKEVDRIRLQPENPSMQPIYVSKDDPNFRIIGKIKGLLRRY